MIFWWKKSPLPLWFCLYSNRKDRRTIGRYFLFQKEDSSSQMIYPDFIRRCILFVENIQDYQVTQLADGSITIALSHRTESMEQAIFCSI